MAPVAADLRLAEDARMEREFTGFLGLDERLCFRVHTRWPICELARSRFVAGLTEQPSSPQQISPVKSYGKQFKWPCNRGFS